MIRQSRFGALAKATGRSRGALMTHALESYAETESWQSLTENPGIGRPGRVIGTRELVVTGTPYLVPYTVSHDTVVILRVLHGAQRWPPV